MSFVIHGIGVSGGIAIGHAQLMAHAAFGLLNSTPHSIKAATARPADLRRSRGVLKAMTVAALSGDGAARVACSP